MYELKRTDRNALKVVMDGQEACLYYRQPTTEEALAYNRGLYDFDGVDGRSAAPKMNYGIMVDAALKVITGWDEQMFGYEGHPISTDPASPHYREDWRDLLRDTATVLLVQVAAKVFGGILVEKSHPFPVN